MYDWQSLSHVPQNCKYHVVILQSPEKENMREIHTARRRNKKRFVPATRFGPAWRVFDASHGKIYRMERRSTINSKSSA